MTNSKQIFSLLLLASCLMLPSSARADPIAFTLNAAIEHALRTNYDINIAEERLTRLKALVGEARSGAMPQITATAAYQRNLRRPQLFFNDTAVTIGSKNIYSSSANLTQSLYEAGKVRKALKAAKSERRRGEAELKDIRDEIVLQVKKTFYQILLMDRTIKITKETLAQLTSHLKAIEKRYNEGLESDYTLMRQEVEVSNIAPELAGAEQSRLVLVNAFKDILTLPAEAELVLEGGLKFSGAKVPPVNDLVAEALAKRGDLTAASARVESLKQKVGVERGGYLPTLSLTTNLTWQAQTDDYRISGSEDYYAWNVGTSLSLPIFDGFKTHFRIREAKADLKIATEEEMKMRAGVISEVKNIRASLAEAVAREAAQKKTLALAEKAAAIAGVRFSEGLMSQLELNDTILARDQAEKLYASAVYDCLAAEAELIRVIGGEL